MMGQVVEDDIDLWRHTVLNTIRMYRTKYKGDYGEIVICADGGGNWRKKIFPQYKGKRDDTREESRIDWEIAFANIKAIYEDIKEHFPYKCLKIYGCEADDTIAELVHRSQNLQHWEQIMIISSDHDYIQLQKYPNVKQFSPLTKKPVTDPDPVLYRENHIIKGCKGDGVPAVLDGDDQLMNGDKKITLTKKKREALLADPKCMGEQVYRNYFRNKTMISLVEDRHTPASVRAEIINTFENQDPSGNSSKVLPFLISKNCRQLLENVSEFI